MSRLKKLILLLVTIFLSTHIVMAENINNFPSFQDGILTIPRVDTPEQAGIFQDARFEFNEPTGTWRLEEFKTKAVNDIKVLINDVDVVVTNTVPVQVFLNIDGDLFVSCSDLGLISQELNNNRFEVLIHDGPLNNPDPPGVDCNAATKPFEKVVPLSVYGLSAGTYEYSVNGGNIGTFTLTEDNKL